MNNTIDPTIGLTLYYNKLAMEADGTRPLKCKYCRSTFRFKQGLDIHIKEVHLHPIEVINTNKQTKINPERVAISQNKPARKDSVIIQNPNVFY